jgi:hypothetical protein
MHSNRNRFWGLAMAVVAALASLSFVPENQAGSLPQQQAQPSGQQSGVAKPIGTIKSIAGNALTLTSDAGPVFNVTVEDSTKLLRIEPGQKDLKNAQPIRLQDLQAGDRILVIGKLSDDNHSVTASSVIVMKRADVESKRENDRQDWQRHGVGGIVSAVDPLARTITISTAALAGNKTIAIDTSNSTMLRRYAPDSVNFDDAKPSTFDQVKPGDQLRARGTRSADGTKLTADEIVSGAFRNIAGTISSIDPAANTLGVMDLITKKPVLVKIAADSQIRKLPPQIAQLIATRVKGSPPGVGKGAGSSAAVSDGGSAGVLPNGSSQSGGQGSAGPGDGSGASRSGGDLQQILSRIPPATLADLQKGDAVMIVSTEGTGSGAITAITLVGGVEAILQASPTGGGQSMILPPWSLDARGGDAAAQ